MRNYIFVKSCKDIIFYFWLTLILNNDSCFNTRNQKKLCQKRVVWWWNYVDRVTTLDYLLTNDTWFFQYIFREIRQIYLLLPLSTAISWIFIHNFYPHFLPTRTIFSVLSLVSGGCNQITFKKNVLFHFTFILSKCYHC